MGSGRFAPSPTSDLHLGNLRTAVVAWLMARSTGRRFLVRIEDLDTARVKAAGQVAQQQLKDLAALGLDWDGDVVYQSERLDLYRDALALLPHYRCFCTRKEIAEAASAPHDGYRPYPGTCRDRRDTPDRPPALRVRVPDDEQNQTVTDLWAGDVSGVVDDFVLYRNDGAPAYNLAVVVDDVAQGVDQVVRADDLLSSSPRQAWLTRRLGGIVPQYAHVPLVVNADGRRLAKRDGSVTLTALRDAGMKPDAVLGLLGHSLGLAEAGEPVTISVLLDHWSPSVLPRAPWTPPSDVLDA